MTNHAHDWQTDTDASDLRTERYRCECGAKGWRSRAVKGKPWTFDLPIRAYAEGSKKAAVRFDKPEPVEINCKPRSAGRNVTGGYLPPSSGGRR